MMKLYDEDKLKAFEAKFDGSKGVTQDDQNEFVRALVSDEGLSTLLEAATNMAKSAIESGDTLNPTAVIISRDTNKNTYESTIVEGDASVFNDADPSEISRELRALGNMVHNDFPDYRPLAVHVVTYDRMRARAELVNGEPAITMAPRDGIVTVNGMTLDGRFNSSEISYEGNKVLSVKTNPMFTQDDLGPEGDELVTSFFAGVAADSQPTITVEGMMERARELAGRMFPDDQAAQDKWLAEIEDGLNKLPDLGEIQRKFMRGEV